MIRKILAQVFRGSMYRNCLERSSLYLQENICNISDAFQLKAFNIVWRDAREHVPFYLKWKKKYDLPDIITSLDELEKWPILTKKELQEDPTALERGDSDGVRRMMTGGSTGEPLRFGTWADNCRVATNRWIGRRAYGIEPGMKTFLLWGHHHLYGKGLNRIINRIIRKLKDKLMNITRFPSYDLSSKAMEHAMQVLKSCRPEFIVGYSPAVLSFCRVNKSNRHECRALNIRCVMCTAGPLCESERIEIMEFFNAPVCMEYGSVECGVMAHTVPDVGDYAVFWDTHLLQPTVDEYGMYRNIVTCITQRYLPLIRYEIGDYLELYPEEVKRPKRFKTVIGRPSEIVTLADGSAFWGNLIGDCVKQIPSVLSSQTLVCGNSLEIGVIVNSQLTEAEEELIVNRCRLAAPCLRDIPIKVEQKTELRTSSSGKIPLIIYK